VNHEIIHKHLLFRAAHVLNAISTVAEMKSYVKK